MQAHLPYSQIHRQDRQDRAGRTSDSSAVSSAAQKLTKVGQGKIWRNTLMMVALFVLTYWLALYWLLPSVGTVAAGIKAPIVCLVFWLGCSFGDRAARYRRR